MFVRANGLYDSLSRRRVESAGGRLGTRQSPFASVTAVSSPCKFGEVTVTTTSLTGVLLDASVTRPVRLAPPSWARASLAARRTTAATDALDQSPKRLNFIDLVPCAC